MKLKNPRTSIAFNLLAIFGWITATLFVFFMPIWNKKELGTGNSGIWLIWLMLIAVIIGFISISYIVHVIELVFDFKINNNFIINNKIYACFVEFGLWLYLFPIIWIWAYIDYTLLPILYLICSYILLKLIIFGIKKLIK